MFLNFNEDSDFDILNLSEEVEEEEEVQATAKDDADEAEASIDAGKNLASEVMEIYYTFTESYYENALACAIAESKSVISEDVNAYNEAEETFWEKTKRIVGEAINWLKKKLSKWITHAQSAVIKAVAFITDKAIMAKIKLFGGSDIIKTSAKDKDGKVITKKFSAGIAGATARGSFMQRFASVEQMDEINSLFEKVKGKLWKSFFDDTSIFETGIDEISERYEEIAEEVYKSSEATIELNITDRTSLGKAVDYIKNGVSVAMHKVVSMVKSIIGFFSNMAHPKPNAEGKVNSFRKVVGVCLRIASLAFRIPFMALKIALAGVRKAVSRVKQFIDDSK